MRGPGLRVKNDVRRIWRCPACLQVRRLPATIVSEVCSCSQPNPQMHLMEGRRAVRTEQAPLPAYIAFEELLGDEPASAVDAAQDDQVVDLAASADAEQLSQLEDAESSPSEETEPFEE